MRPIHKPRLISPMGRAYLIMFACFAIGLIGIFTAAP